MGLSLLQWQDKTIRLEGSIKSKHQENQTIAMTIRTPSPMLGIEIARRISLSWEAPAQCLDGRAAPTDLNAAVASAIPALSRNANGSLPMVAVAGSDSTLMPA